jgi:hypothetical protein
MQEHPLIELRAADRHWLGRTCLSPPGLIVALLVLALATSTSVMGQNGETEGAVGLHEGDICEAQYTTYCDMRFDGDVVACHLRELINNVVVDEGLAIADCTGGGRLTTGAAEGEFLEREVTVKGWDAGQIYCGSERVGPGQFVEFCVVCDTVNSTGSGKKNVIAPGIASCVKIVNDGQPAATGQCGAYSIAPDPGNDCFAATESLRRTFSDPMLGFFITTDLAAAGVKGGKHLTVCSNRSWECLDTVPPPLGSEVQLSPQQGQGLIHTPGCISLKDGSRRCF